MLNENSRQDLTASALHMPVKKGNVAGVAALNVCSKNSIKQNQTLRVSHGQRLVAFFNSSLRRAAQVSSRLLFE